VRTAHSTFNLRTALHYCRTIVKALATDFEILWTHR
jgi:hypothetical protein